MSLKPAKSPEVDGGVCITLVLGAAFAADASHYVHFLSAVRACRGAGIRTHRR
jgi:hypothetical protein